MSLTLIGYRGQNWDSGSLLRNVRNDELVLRIRVMSINNTVTPVPSPSPWSRITFGITVLWMAMAVDDPFELSVLWASLTLLDDRGQNLDSRDDVSMFVLYLTFTGTTVGV